MSLLLTPETLQTIRPAGTLREWVLNTIEKLGLTVEGRSAVILGRGYAKPLVQELLPIGHFCVHRWGMESQVTIEPVLGNQNFDARVHGPIQQTGGIAYIEVTQAHEGENEYLRRMVFDRDGCVDPYGEITKTGTKNTGITVQINSEAQRHTSLIKRQMELIVGAISRKQDKKYPTGTVLVVVFDDDIFKDEFGDFEIVDMTAKEQVQRLNNVQWLSLVGSSGRTFWINKTPQPK